MNNDVFVFGSNASGFHGAGSAGEAFRGDSRNNWRQDANFLTAIGAPAGSEEKVGLRAIFGQSRGLMQGSEGYGYGICTVTKPGRRRSITRKEIACQLRELFRFAKEHPELTFNLTPVGCGYAGYSRLEMQEIIDWLLTTEGQPANLNNIACYKQAVFNKDT